MGVLVPCHTSDTLLLPAAHIYVEAGSTLKVIYMNEEWDSHKHKNVFALLIPTQSTEVTGNALTMPWGSRLVMISTR